MESLQRYKYLARINRVNLQNISAEFNTELHLPLPAFGTLVKISCASVWLYGLISDARVNGESQADIDGLFENPVPLGTEIQIIAVGYVPKNNTSSLPVQELPPEMPSIGDYVFMPSEEELQMFTIELGFLKLLLNHPVPIAENLIVTAIRKFSTVYPDPQSFMIRVTQELSRLTLNNRDAFRRIVDKSMNSSVKKASV